MEVHLWKFLKSGKVYFYLGFQRPTLNLMWRENGKVVRAETIRPTLVVSQTAASTKEEVVEFSFQWCSDQIVIAGDQYLFKNIMYQFVY